MVRFIKKAGRIIPIKMKQYPTASGLAIVAGSAIAGTKIRQKAMETIRGKGKKGTGSVAGNLTTDFAITSGLLYGIGKKSSTARDSLMVAHRLFKRSF